MKRMNFPGRRELRKQQAQERQTRFSQLPIEKQRQQAKRFRVKVK